MSAQRESFEPADLIRLLSELSGHFRFYAADLERLSLEVSRLAVGVAQRVESGERPTSEQLKRAESFSSLFCEGSTPDYDFHAAGAASARVWATAQVLAGKLFFVNDSLLDAEELAQSRASAASDSLS